MLKIYFGNMPEAIYNTDIFFNNTYDEDWLLDDFAKEVIRKLTSLRFWIVELSRARCLV